MDDAIVIGLGRGVELVQPVPTNRQLVINLGILRSLIGQDQCRGKRRGMLTLLIQSRHLNQPVPMLWLGGSNQQPAKRLVRNPPNAPIGIRYRSSQRVQRRGVPNHPQRHRSGITIRQVTPAQDRG
jgi:hypothetical protein